MEDATPATAAERPLRAPSLPPVERAAEGIWAIPLPLPDNPLGFVSVYAVESRRGPYLVDSGWNTAEAWAALVAGLGRLGAAVEDVRGVLVTHVHPDHYGLAGRIQEASGAWVGLHPADAALIAPRYQDPQRLLPIVGATLRAAGAPADEVAALQYASMGVLPRVSAVAPDVLVEDGQRLDVPGRDLIAVWTPGHTPGHLCVHDARNRILLSGDHVLPRITPNVSLHDLADVAADPLGDYLTSLVRVADLAADVVLPGHEHRFTGLRERAHELIAHHEARFAEIVAAVSDGATTAWQLAAAMRWSRPWDGLHGFMQRMALFEALAHLRALERRGLLARSAGEPATWSLRSR